MSFGLQRVVLGTWSRDGHVRPPSWERAVLRLTITGPSYEERLTRSGSHRCEPLIKSISVFMSKFQTFDPVLYFRLVGAHFMTIEAEAFLHIGIGVCLAQVAHARAQAAALMGGKRIDGLSVEVVGVEEGEHHLRVRPPPYGTTDEDDVIVGKEIYDVCRFDGFAV